MPYPRRKTETLCRVANRLAALAAVLTRLTTIAEGFDL